MIVYITNSWLKDFATNNNNASSSESDPGGLKQKSVDNDEDDVFEMENDDVGSSRTTTPQQPSQPSKPLKPLEPSASTPLLLQPTSTPLRGRRVSGEPQSACSAEQSFLQSRLGHSTIESILDSQEKLKKEEETPARSMDYFSEPELNSPLGSRPPSPVLSDTGRH